MSLVSRYAPKICQIYLIFPVYLLDIHSQWHYPSPLISHYLLEDIGGIHFQSGTSQLTHYSQMNNIGIQYQSDFRVRTLIFVATHCMWDWVMTCLVEVGLSHRHTPTVLDHPTVSAASSMCLTGIPQLFGPSPTEQPNVRCLWIFWTRRYWMTHVSFAFFGVSSNTQLPYLSRENCFWHSVILQSKVNK